MKVCVVVCNSIWYDPRVNRQIEVYRVQQDVELCCVGVECNRYDEKKVEAYGLPIVIVKKPEKYKGKMKTPIGKVVRELYMYRMIAKAIEEQKPDIIHANDLDAFIPAMMAARKLKCKVVYDSHEIYVENNVVVAAPKIYRDILEFVESKLVKKCALMVSVSHAAAEYFAKKYDIVEPMVVTNCALKSARFEGKEKTDKFEVLNHGQFYAGRGYEIMAQACELIADYPEIRLAIRGFGVLEESLRKTVAEQKNPEQFAFYPKVTVQELIPMASKSHVGVAVTIPNCLNFKLSVSNKLFEYAAAGLPVILSDIPEHRYLNDQYDFGLILPENTPEAFAKAVIQLYTDHELYERLSKNALRLAAEVNWENEFERLLEAERALTAQK